MRVGYKLIAFSGLKLGLLRNVYASPGTFISVLSVAASLSRLSGMRAVATVLGALQFPKCLCTGSLPYHVMDVSLEKHGARMLQPSATICVAPIGECIVLTVSFPSAG